MRNKNKTENVTEAENSVKILTEAEEVRHLIEKKKIQNSILKKLIGNIPKLSDSSTHPSNH
jgi:hypothetical protein